MLRDLVKRIVGRPDRSPAADPVIVRSMETRKRARASRKASLDAVREAAQQAQDRLAVRAEH